MGPDVDGFTSNISMNVTRPLSNVLASLRLIEVDKVKEGRASFDNGCSSLQEVSGLGRAHKHVHCCIWNHKAKVILGLIVISNEVCDDSCK